MVEVVILFMTRWDHMFFVLDKWKNMNVNVFNLISRVKWKNMKINVFNLMLRVKKTRFLVLYESGVNMDWRKMFVIKSKNGNIMNFGVSVSNNMVGVLVKMIIFGILPRVILNMVRKINWRIFRH